MYDNNGLDFDDEPIDLTDPNRNVATNQRYTTYEQTTPKPADPFIMKFTGILVKIAMTGAIVFLIYLISLGAFDIDKNIGLIKNGCIAIYAVFVIDSLIMGILNKSLSAVLIAVLLPVFYPLKRSYMTYDKKNIQGLWLAVLFVLLGFVINNLYPQLYERFQLLKTSRDEYTSECDDAVKYLKGIKAESGDMFIEIIKDKFDDYTIEAQKNADGTYNVTVVGDTKLTVDGAFSTDAMLKDNTKVTFFISAALDNYSVAALQINGEEKNIYAKVAWSQLCTAKE